MTHFLGLAGLHLEMANARVASAAALAHADSSLVPHWHSALEKRANARAAFRAELERVTGLPSELIERRLAL